MKRLLRLYPTAWRARYEAEVTDLLEELPVDRRVAVDLFRGAMTERARAAWLRIPESPLPAGGSPMFASPVHRHPTLVALAALVAVVPTTTFVVLSLLAFELGVIGLQPIIEPVMASLPATGFFNVFVIVAPALALVIAIAPLVSIGLSRASGGLLLTVALRARVLNLAVIGICLIVGIVLAWHHVVEVMLESGL